MRKMRRAMVAAVAVNVLLLGLHGAARAADEAKGAGDSKDVAAPEKIEKVEKKAEPELQKRLAIGTGGAWWQPGANLQGWYVFDHYNEAGNNPGTNANTFRIRRAELSVKGEIIPRTFGFGVMIDPARVNDGQAMSITIKDDAGKNVGTGSVPTSSNFAILQDVYLTWLNDYAEVTLGQFKIPVSWEGVLSSSKLVFPERALVSKQFGDKRDIGLKVQKKFKYFMYWAGVYNGSGQNQIDTNMAKDLTLRVEGYPIEGLMVGGVVYSPVGDFNDKANSWRVRYEADLRFERWGFLLQAEYINSQDRKAGGKMYFGNGYYVMVGYKVLDQLTFAVRFGQLNGDTTHVLKTTDSAYVPFTTHIEGAVSWQIRKDDLKLHASYSRFDTNNFKPTDNQVIVALQVAY